MSVAGFDFTVRDRAVYLPSCDAVVLADLHLGKIESSRLMLPSDEATTLGERLAALVGEFDPARVVVAGDVLHDFSTIPSSVTASLTRIEEAITAADAEPVFIEGNHDTLLATQVDPVPSIALEGGVVVCHGHEHPPVDGEWYVIGHDHPAVRIEGQLRPCYLYGDGVYQDADVLVLPAFSPFIAGTAINARRGTDFQSPFLRSLDEFHPILIDESTDEPLVFPRLGDFRELL